MQQKCGCIIGKDYPKPIVDHAGVKQRNIERMKMARKAKYGEESSDGQGTLMRCKVRGRIKKYIIH